MGLFGRKNKKVVDERTDLERKFEDVGQVAGKKTGKFVQKSVDKFEKVKEDLALEITTRFHSENKAKMAKEAFDNLHKKSQIPTDIAEFSLDGEIWIAKALVECNISPSTSQARRDIKQGAVKIDKQKVSDEQLQLGSGDYILQVGKRKFAKLKVN